VRSDRQGLRLVFGAAWLLGLQVGCAQPKAENAKRPSPDVHVASSAAASSSEPKLAASPSASDAGPPEITQIDPDGNDEPEDPGAGTVPEKLTLERVGTPPLALTRICDLTVLGDTLFMAHANQPLGTDGATITKYKPDPKTPFKVAFDWNRPGEPTKGGGAGQGFLRIRKIDGKLFVPDSDPPYGGLGVVDWGTEGYVFRSDEQGVFAKARMPSFKPPATAGVLPRAYHVLDVIKFKGAIHASTGSVPPKERAWKGPAPGALHKANEDLSRWTYETDYPFPWNDDVTRVTFMVRFKDRLYAGFQAFNGTDPNDYVYWTELDHEHRHAARVTKTGSAQTLRWWVDTQSKPHRLYWLSWARDGILLRVSTDGDTWNIVDLPDDAGRPTDVTRFRDRVVVLTERGLHALDPETGTTAIATLAKVEEKKSPFVLDDYFCTAPLAVFENALYAGGQRGGTLYRFRDGE
jgi:hypothetical protein